VTPALRQFIETRICPTLEVSYGSTEAGLIASIDRHIYREQPECHGRLRPWVVAQAVDDHDTPVPAGMIGLLRFQSPLAVSAYAGDPEVSGRVFRGGWFYPGDRGSIDAAGYLKLAGRADHVLNVDGEKVDPTLIESVLDSYPGITESAVIALPIGESGRRILIAAIVSSGAIDGAALQRHCAQRLDSSCVPVRLILRETLPKNAGGKLMRDALQEEIVAALRA
jgi:acyl-coenzyme A synthetase/AMP-(fatty) acid ligase